MRLKIKRVYEHPDAQDGTRILVDRLWPRGLTKAKASDSLLDDSAPLRMGHRLEAVVRAELAVDVMEMIAKRLGGYAQTTGNRRGIVPSREEPEDAVLLLGERLDGWKTGRVAGQGQELARSL